MNLRHIKRRPESITKDNIGSTIITDIIDMKAIQKKLFKLNCKWNGAHSNVILDTFTHILINPIGRMSYYDENDSFNSTFEKYFKNDSRMKTYTLVNANRL